MNNKFKTGDIVYVIDNGIIKAKLKEPYEQDGQKGFWVNFQYNVDETGKRIYDFYLGGTSVRLFNAKRPEHGIYRTAKEAYDVFATLQYEQYESYAKSINTVEELVLFPLENNIDDTIARKVYVEKAKELLDIDIESLFEHGKPDNGIGCITNHVKESIER